ncbi:MAG TPA: ABC transporter permease [Actinobacteria bacterium]|nr:ABC transporter permease [Actinomycetota bacterium]
METVRVDVGVRERSTGAAPGPALTITARRRITLALQAAFLLFVAFVLFGPVVILAIFSFNDSIVLGFPFKGLTLSWYAQAWGEPNLWGSLAASLKVAVVVTPVCLILGLASAFALTRFRFRFRGAVGGFVALPLVIPWLIIGVGGLLFFSSAGVRLGLPTVGIMHVVIAFPLVTALLSAQLFRLDPHLHEAALDLGADERTTLRLVVLPLLLPTLAASAIFVFSWSFNNFIVSFFTAGFDNTFPIWVFSTLRRARDLPMVNAISTLISAAQVLVVVVAWQLLRRAMERRGQDIRDIVAG